ncbi:CynX/NimT family MFS transporter [Chloroflexota bacterium]
MKSSSDEAPPDYAEKKEPYQQGYRWVILALLCLAYFAFVVIARCISPLVTPILEDLNISYSQMGMILGSWQLTYIVVAIIAGTIIDRLGLRKALFVGIAIVGLSGILRYFPEGFTALLLAVALFGIGGPMISIGCPKAVSQWFHGKERGIAIGWYSTGSRLGGLFALAATNSLVMPMTGYSWRLTFVYYGLMTIAVALLWLFFAREKRSSDDTASAGVREVFLKLIKVRDVRIILIIGFLYFAANHGFVNWLPNILEAGGMTPSQAGFAASLPVLVGLPTILIVPRLIPSHLRGRFTALFTFVSAIAIVLTVTTSGASLFAGLVIYGVISSPLIPMLMLILMDIPEVGSAYMGSAGGMFFCVAEIGGFAAPLIMGVLVDVTQSFLSGTVLLAVFCLIISVMALLMKT